MEPDKLKKCEWLINEMMKHLSVEVKGVSLCIQLEQAKQSKRIADSLERLQETYQVRRRI